MSSFPGQYSKPKNRSNFAFLRFQALRLYEGHGERSRENSSGGIVETIDLRDISQQFLSIQYVKPRVVRKSSLRFLTPRAEVSNPQDSGEGEHSE